MERVIPRIEDVFSDLAPIETERLLLRKMALADAEDMFEYASDPEVTNYTTWYPHTSIEDSRQFLEHITGRYDRHGVAEWGVIHKRDRKFIGTCGYIYWEPQHARAEIGYALSRSYWGQGLMSEAAREVISFGFRNMTLNRVEARCLPENIGSARVLEKSGMNFEGILRQHMYIKGRYIDLKMYAIVRSDWSK